MKIRHNNVFIAFLAAAVFFGAPISASAAVTQSTRTYVGSGAAAVTQIFMPAQRAQEEYVEPVLTAIAEAMTERIRTVAEETMIKAEEVLDARDPYRDRPDIDTGDWMYILANPWNEIGDYTPELETLERQQFDERIVDDMEAFAEAARAEGLSVFLSSGYRGYDMQSYLFRRKVDEYGEAVAQTIVARPGTSEHQTGLCCDITDRYYEQKDSSLENTALYQWMSEHCQEYGFIVRYPKGKEDVTGIIYEPWHFRYVGVEAATYIMEHELTLEEFLELYE